MAIPKISDLVLYVNKAIRGVDWNTNWQKIINWLTGGDADLNVKSVTTDSISNNGTISSDGLNVNGDADISGNLVVGGVISGDGSGLTNVQSTSTIAYTPFVVNKGYVGRIPDDSSTYGKEILMKKKVGYNSLIEFDEFINENTPLTCTTSDGTTFTLDHLDDLDVSNQQLSKTYIVCVKKGQQRAELKEGVYRQRLAPTDVSIPNNSLWLDTSTENIQCYEKLNNVWTEKYDGVPIGEIVVTNGEIASDDDIKTYHYNWNGYNINVQEEINIYQRPVIIIKTYVSGNNWYRIYSDGFVEQGGREDFPSGSATTTKTITYHIPLATSPRSINLTPIANNSYVADTWGVNSKSASSMSVFSGVYGSRETSLLWEVKGYK